MLLWAKLPPFIAESDMAVVGRIGLELGRALDWCEREVGGEGGLQMSRNRVKKGRSE